MIERCLAEGSHFTIAWFGLIPMCAVIVLSRYLWVSRWDQAWRERWERKRGRSLDTLREQTARLLRKFPIALGIVGALIVGFEVSGRLDLFLAAIRGETLSNAQIMWLCSKVEYLMLWLVVLLVGGTLGIISIRFQLRKMDELLGRRS